MDVEARVASQWWVGKLSAPCGGSGDPMIDALASMAPRTEHSPETLLTFRDALENFIVMVCRDARDGVCVLSVDYDPQGWLAEALALAGIDELQPLPFKITMRVSEGRVTVHNGYRAKEEVLYPPA